MRDYMIISPSVDGILAHDSILYGGIKRPTKLLRVYDSPAKVSLGKSGKNGDEQEIERYFGDLYGVFMTRFSQFVVDREVADDDTITMQAMLQEMIKVKKILLS